MRARRKGQYRLQTLEVSTPKEHRLRHDGVEICWFEWGDPGGPEVVLVHATGFHARCWDRVVARLPAHAHVWAVDMRGHGRSQKQPPYRWDVLAGDLEAGLESLGVQHAVGVGHSAGGHCMAQLAPRTGDLFKSLILIDPVIFEPARYEANETFYTSVDEHPVARRRELFADWHAMHDRFADRHPYTLWRPEIFEDYCRYGVAPDPSGDGVRLCCPARVEASVYMNNFTTDPHVGLKDIHQPVTILRAPPSDHEDPSFDFAASPTWPELASYLPNATDVYLEDLTHFIPMQAPELVAHYIERSL